MLNEKFVNVVVNVAMPNMLVASPTLVQSACVRHVGAGDDRDAPGASHAAAEPHPAVVVEEHVDARLDVDLVGAERAVVERAAGVAEHFGADAVDGRRGERARDDAVGELELLVREKR